MDPLQIQAFVEAQVRRQLRSELASQAIGKQYAVTKIPAHTHNQTDSLGVQFSDLVGAVNYSAITRITITPAQVKTLFSTPVVLVPQPGPLSVIIVDGITVRLKYSGTAYAGTHNLEFHYTNGSGDQVTDSVPASFLNSTSNATYYAPAVSSSFTPVVGGSGINGQIVAFVNTANPTLGNSQITFVVQYHIVSFNA